MISINMFLLKYNGFYGWYDGFYHLDVYLNVYLITNIINDKYDLNTFGVLQRYDRNNYILLHDNIASYYSIECSKDPIEYIDIEKVKFLEIKHLVIVNQKGIIDLIKILKDIKIETFQNQLKIVYSLLDMCLYS